jgi:hypothetical protein
VSLLNGLPAHVLLVHFVVVLVPLTALALAVCAIRPSAAQRMGIVLPLLALVTLASVPLATEAGGWLEEHVDSDALVRRHAALGDGLLPWVGGLFVLAVFVWWTARRTAASGSGSSRGTRRSAAPVRVAVAVLSLVVAVGAAVDVYRIGDSGAKAASACGWVRRNPSVPGTDGPMTARVPASTDRTEARASRSRSPGRRARLSHAQSRSLSAVTVSRVAPGSRSANWATTLFSRGPVAPPGRHSTMPVWWWPRVRPRSRSARSMSRGRRSRMARTVARCQAPSPRRGARVRPGSPRHQGDGAVHHLGDRQQYRGQGLGGQGGPHAGQQLLQPEPLAFAHAADDRVEGNRLLRTARWAQWSAAGRRGASRAGRWRGRAAGRGHRFRARPGGRWCS